MPLCLGSNYLTIVCVLKKGTIGKGYMYKKYKKCMLKKPIIKKYKIGGIHFSLDFLSNRLRFLEPVVATIEIGFEARVSRN
jgi:hypothetical protein